MTTARATSSMRNTAPVEEPVPIADPTTDSGLLSGAGSVCEAGDAAGGALDDGAEPVAAWCLWWRLWAGSCAPALPLELASPSTALPAGPCCSSCLVVDFDTGCECFLWWPELPPGLGSASQYWSIAEVPGGAWQVLAAPAGCAISAEASRAEAKAILHV